MSETSPSPDAASAPSWTMIPRWARWGVSIFLLFHLCAIATPPLVVPPTSALFQRVALVFRPYLQALYLHHGFHYFAPQPGESTLVKYSVMRDDREPHNGIMPDRKIWPRLLYHRHFMLTESLSYVPEPLRPAWYQSYANCLARKYNGRTVKLTHVLHYMPTSPSVILSGAPLDHPDSFEEMELGDFSCQTE